MEARIKPYNHNGHLDFFLENITINNFYVKKQVYDLVFADVAVFFVQFKTEETKKYYKLIPDRPTIKYCPITIDDGSAITICMDFSLIT
jgi:hypothetical protein